MSTSIAYLALRLEGPLQAWGFDSQYNHRNTGLLPTKSAILGMCCAALGLPRGSTVEADWLKRLRNTRMLAVAIPRVAGRHGKPLPVRRLTDYHTVQNTKTAEGKDKDTHLTYRQYLCDAAFGAVLSGERLLLNDVARALDDPVWGVWLGRKACVPTTPILAKPENDWVFANEEEALRALIGDTPLQEFTHQREVENFADGVDTLPDQPANFDSAHRAHAPRRVVTFEAKIGNID